MVGILVLGQKDRDIGSEKHFARVEKAVVEHNIQTRRKTVMQLQMQ